MSATRDRRLIRALLERAWACGTRRVVLLCTDGLVHYPKQAPRVFRVPERTGRRGHPRLLRPAGVLIAQTIKRYAQRRVVAVERRIVHGTATTVADALRGTQGTPTAVINTAYIERLNATFRARCSTTIRTADQLTHGSMSLWRGCCLTRIVTQLGFPSHVVVLLMLRAVRCTDDDDHREVHVDARDWLAPVLLLPPGRRDGRW